MTCPCGRQASVPVDKCGAADNTIFSEHGGISFPKTCRERCEDGTCPEGFS